MKYVYAVAVAAAVSCAMQYVAAEPNQKAVVPPSRGVLILPPLEYDYPYPGKLTIERVATISELQDRCGVTKWLLGCSWRRADSCLIVLVGDDVIRHWNWTPEVMMRHEIGHCNGWPGDHPGQRAHWEPPGKPPSREEMRGVIKPVYKPYPKPEKDQSRFPQ